MNYLQACKIIFNECPDPYARSYAKYGAKLTNVDHQRQQALYMLNNISYWRTPTAARVRGFLKSYAKELM